MVHEAENPYFHAGEEFFLLSAGEEASQPEPQVPSPGILPEFSAVPGSIRIFPSKL